MKCVHVQMTVQTLTNEHRVLEVKKCIFYIFFYFQTNFNQQFNVSVVHYFYSVKHLSRLVFSESGRAENTATETPVLIVIF